MRVMVVVRASNESESGALPDEQILAEMGKLNEEQEERLRKQAADQQKQRAGED